MTDDTEANSDVTLVARKINRGIYRKFKQKALEENINIGKALNQAMSDWIRKQSEEEKPNINKLLELNSVIKTKKQVNWSEQIDETLYGEVS